MLLKPVPLTLANLSSSLTSLTGQDLSGSMNTLVPFLNNNTNQLQDDLDQLKLFTDRNMIQINEKKTPILCINFRKSLQFPPIFSVGHCSQLDVVKHTKLLGIIVSDDLRWAHHVEYMCQRAYKKIWLLRRMEILQLDQEIMLYFYCKEVRSILEFGVAFLNSGLTVKKNRTNWA